MQLILDPLDRLQIHSHCHPLVILPVLDREKIDLGKPILTLDVNQIALKSPPQWPAGMHGLAPLEYNYFERASVELCVTPETPFEIIKGRPLATLGYDNYCRFQKTEFFKNRPSGSTLSLSEQEANSLWLATRQILWPTVTDAQLTPQQRADVSQVYFHTIASGSTLAHSAFLTVDQNFINKRVALKSDLGITVYTPDEAWTQYSSQFGLYAPTAAEIAQIRLDQQRYFAQLSSNSGSLP